jgi:hypothetical protein
MRIEGLKPFTPPEVKQNSASLESKKTEENEFSKILSQREKAYLSKSFPKKEADVPVRPKEFLGRYIDIKT